jgi:hypothetical protein
MNMKKRVLGIFIVVAIALVSGWNIIQSKSDVTISDMALENIDALAQEVEHLYPGYLYVTHPSFGTVTCSGGGYFYCI